MLDITGSLSFSLRELSLILSNGLVDRVYIYSVSWDNQSNYCYQSNYARGREAEQWIIDANSKVIGLCRRDDLIEIEMIDTIKSETISCASKRYVWARDKFYAAQKRHMVGFFIVARMLRAKLNSAHSSIIDAGFCHKKRTKVIQIVVTLNNESHDRLVNFHAIYRLYHTYMQDNSEASHIPF